MAIADWEDSHRNETKRNQTQGTNTNAPTTTHLQPHTRQYTCATTHPLIKPSQPQPQQKPNTNPTCNPGACAASTRTPPHGGSTLQRAHGRRNLQKTEDREGKEGRPRQQGERQGEREGRRSLTTRPRKAGGRTLCRQHTNPERTTTHKTPSIKPT